ncbi:MAG: hypothetical protein ACD_30C00040G0028 [uncultured bacterium]|uniref:Uncharacterized protein n=2 Tax=Candidatus Daviesiibacteriota TaxID=1752718 RepID=A0A0G0ETK2_9BACT|nr:MAG: hypothetical protein ACD_30C00040G0028 [uncultured bacterium]KKQ10168.1 MAG: hypothetical protein US19_C0008G0011 [Candidatus Daviesbacteria bacterium GW2011_GWB1_36_5]KKQ13601.1 MAG: hypothetical protein US28_C0048G0004 [Candidatus Daviesbacteria bacterium GW2011_GWA1_36_8]
MGFGDYYKGDTKKKKKGQGGKQISIAPVFTPPKVAPKGKDKF